ITLAFFAKFITPFDNAGFRNPIFFCEAPHGSAFLQAETDNLFLKWFVVRLWHDKILHLLLYFISHLCYNFSLSLQPDFKRLQGMFTGKSAGSLLLCLRQVHDFLYTLPKGRMPQTGKTAVRLQWMQPAAALYA
ncbi:hypothetical protein GCWU000341_02638, partial [Oribacterium sp. oral taxon 078 str. F0262]